MPAVAKHPGAGLNAGRALHAAWFMKAALHALQVLCHSTEVGRELAVGCGRQRASSVDEVEPANPFFLSCKPAQAHVTSAAAVPVDNEAVRARALGQAVAPHAQPMGSVDTGGEGGRPAPRGPVLSGMAKARPNP